MLVGTVNQNASLLGVQLQRITQYILLLQELDKQKIVNIVMDLPLTLYLTSLPANKTLLKIPHREHLSIQIRYTVQFMPLTGRTSSHYTFERILWTFLEETMNRLETSNERPIGMQWANNAMIDHDLEIPDSLENVAVEGTLRSRVGWWLVPVGM